jgi:hypothetical protein
VQTAKGLKELRSQTVRLFKKDLEQARSSQDGERSHDGQTSSGRAVALAVGLAGFEPLVVLVSVEAVSVVQAVSIVGNAVTEFGFVGSSTNVAIAGVGDAVYGGTGITARGGGDEKCDGKSEEGVHRAVCG